MADDIAGATFTDRVIRHWPESTPVCADCGSFPKINWVNITTQADRTNGLERWVHGTYVCPNGPHDAVEQPEARRG